MNRYFLMSIFYLFYAMNLHCNANINEAKQICHYFFKLLYESSVQYLPPGKNVANPEFKVSCISDNKLYDKLQPKLKLYEKKKAITEYEQFELAAFATLDVFLWSRRSISLKNCNDYYATWNEDHFVYWPTKQHMLLLVENICNTYDFIDNKKRKNLQKNLKKIALDSWRTVNNRPPITQGKYLNGYIANGFSQASGDFMDVINDLYIKDKNKDVMIIYTTFQLIRDIDITKMRPWLNAKWQLELQLAVYAGMFLLDQP